MPNEIELKLRVARADVARLRRHPALRQHLAGKPLTRRLVSIYYDTPQLTLLDAGLSLRVRRMAGGWFQAVKAAGHSLGGLHQRMEWEDIIHRGVPDFTKINAPELAIFNEQQLRDALTPIFVTDVKRSEWQLAYADGSQLEVALDLGELQAGGQLHEICEIELELKQGRACHVFELALALQADIPLMVEDVSKAQRGYACYRPITPAVVTGNAVRFDRKARSQQAMQGIIGECLRHLQGNVPMVLDGRDSEGVHQMRVACRRIRAAMRLFDMRPQQIVDDLRWLNGMLGKARDWDVLFETTLVRAGIKLAGAAPSQALLKSVQARRVQNYRQLKRALQSQRYQRLLLMLGALLVQDRPATDRKAIDQLRQSLLKQHRQLQKYGKRWQTLTLEQLHRLRIRVKHLRYAVDFELPLPCGKQPMKKQLKQAQPYLKRLMQLQTVMGKFNDTLVTERLLQPLNSRPDSLLPDQELSLIRQWNAARGRKLQRQIQQAWRKFLATVPYWQ